MELKELSKLVSKITQRVELLAVKKNKDYWRKGIPYLEEVELKILLDPYVRKTQLRTGEIDFLELLDYSDVEDIRKTEGIKLMTNPGGNWDYICFNQTAEPYSIKEVRQAIAYAVDREALVNNVYYGEGEPDDDPLNPPYIGAEPDQSRYPNTSDVETAKELLANAGYADGFDTTIITSDKSNCRRSTEIVLDQLGKVGIRAKMEGLDMGTFNGRRREGEYEVALEDINISTTDSDSALYWFLHKDQTFAFTGWENDAVNQLLDQGRAISDVEERGKIYRQVLDIALEESIYVYLCHSNLIYAMNEKVTGFRATGNNSSTEGFKDVQWEA